MTPKQATAYRKRSSRAAPRRSTPETPPQVPATAGAPGGRSARAARRASVATRASTVSPAATERDTEQGDAVSKPGKRKAHEQSSSPEPPATAEAADDGVGAFERARLVRCHPMSPCSLSFCGACW